MAGAFGRLAAAVGSAKPGKASKGGRIPAELLKAAGGVGLRWFWDVLRRSAIEGRLPSGLRDPDGVWLHKGVARGPKWVLKNYRNLAIFGPINAAHAVLGERVEEEAAERLAWNTFGAVAGSGAVAAGSWTNEVRVRRAV